MRRLFSLGLFFAILFTALLVWRSRSGSSARDLSPVGGAVGDGTPSIVKQPVNFATKIFDPNNMPGDMPPLPPGEVAECDSDFRSGAIVSGQSRQVDETHAIVTITNVKVTLQLNINIWIPPDATARVVEHEDGHRQISEYYYKTADKLAARIASPYIGKKVEVSGPDLQAASTKLLEQTGADITAEYNRELSTGPAQEFYDNLTDHSRSDVTVSDAIRAAIQNTSGPGQSPDSASIPAN